MMASSFNFRPAKRPSAKNTITITFGDQAENSVGMEKRGKMADQGISVSELEKILANLTGKGADASIIYLPLPEGNFKDSEGSEPETSPAAVLIIRGGVDALLGKGAADAMLAEQSALKFDTKALMRGQVKNKLARHNLCYDDEGQEADIAAGKGTVVAFKDLPLTNALREALPNVFGESTRNLKAEGNLYYDVSKCYIGFHGDAERRIVVAARLGQPFPLFFQWYYRSDTVGEMYEISLGHGDIYCMSEKAVGTDWRRRIIPTLRHAAGSKKALKL